MPRSSRCRSGQAWADEDAQGSRAAPSANDAASSDDDDFRRRRPKQRPAERPATRKELRAVAPGGLLIEDVLQRIGFDDGLPDLETFCAFVDVAFAETQKWCSSFCWTGQCRYGNDCKYSHDVCELRLWKPAAALTPTRVIGIPAMSKKRLSAIRQEGLALHSVAFLTFDGQVVWGRDLGASNADIWSLFVKSWQTPSIDRSATSKDPATKTSSTGAADWAQLPDVVWLRIALATSVEDLSAIALAVPYANWGEIIDLYWPEQCTSQEIDTGSSSQQCVRGLAIKVLCQVASLCTASRLTAQFLRWPQASSGSEAGAFCSVGSSPLQSLGTASQASPLHVYGSQFSPPERIASQIVPAEQGDASLGYTCPAVQEMLSCAAGDPVSIPVDTAVLEEGICMDGTLLVVLSRGGCFRAIRLNDLKQVCGLIVREANCFDFRDELLIVGTSTPARLVAYDLSVPKPSKPSYQLRLEGVANVDVASVSFTDSSTLVCSLQAEDRLYLDEARVVSCEDDGFVVLQQFSVQYLVPMNTKYFAAVAEGVLCVWDSGAQSFDSNACTDLQVVGENGLTAPVRLATGCNARFVAAGGSFGSVLVHDLSSPGEKPLQLGGGTKLDFQLVAGAASNPDMSIQWVVRHLFLDGPVIFVLTEQCGGESSLELLSSVDPASFDLLFLSAWHLPTRRTLLSNWPLRGHITAFSRWSSNSANRTLAFSVSQPVGREGRLAHCVVLPGSTATKVLTGRRTGFTGPQRHKVSGSDLRARRSAGMRKR
eukprot:TRINITY_DN28424_c0_g1_i4.p1 TRINITY_DN28424_c0_g1~~TRINITY_DN28424_c0_g1_i4.p1  ORF type:complete len:768 (+),score=101.02 TRINITY_DN28424_c0_g1_i4:35-2338(+)